MLYIKFFVLRVGVPTLIIIISLIIGAYYGYTHRDELASEADTVSGSPFHYYFKTDGVLEEQGSMTRSTSPYFWLNSGGRLILANGVGKTVQGKLPINDPWRLLYGITNPLDTDTGYLPQNLFRLITKSTWNNVSETLRFRIESQNLTDTPNRGAWSGVLLMSRYVDSNNLYYAGVRVDGTAVIKKKYKGVYYTLASGTAFPSALPYHRDTNPSLIPEDVWMGLRTTASTTKDGAVVVALLIDRTDTGTWEPLLTATDTLGKNGANVILGPAYAGIRTDYADVTFDDYDLRPL